MAMCQGGNSIDTLCHPATNLLFLDAARVNETVIAHELGHAWVQYVDECEDHRTMEDASDPQRMRHVAFVQSFMLDLKVNDLLRRKGFDMSPIEGDQAASVWQLAEALQRGYQPEHPREEVFMALLVADEMLERDQGRRHELAKFDRSLDIIRDQRLPLANLAASFADSVRKRGYGSHEDIVASIDECLLASFEHCGDQIDLDRELVLVNPEDPNIDKFPAWLPSLKPATKCLVGKHMARNDISSDWAQRLEASITGRAKVFFVSPEKDRSNQVVLQERIGPPNRYSDLPEVTAELLALKHLNQTGRYQLTGGPAFQTSDLHKRPDLPTPMKGTPQIPGQPDLVRLPSGAPLIPSPEGPTVPTQPDPFATHWLSRPYMAGYGRFLTQAVLEMQLTGEHPYGYAMENPVTYTDPSGLNPKGSDWDGVHGTYIQNRQPTISRCLTDGWNSFCTGMGLNRAEIIHMMRCIIGCESANTGWPGRSIMWPDNVNRQASSSSEIGDPNATGAGGGWNVGPTRINAGCQDSHFKFPYQDWYKDECHNIQDGLALLCYWVSRHGSHLPPYWSQDAPCYSKCMKLPVYYGPPQKPR